MPSGRLASAVTTPALEIEPLFHQKLSPGSGSVAPITLLRALSVEFDRSGGLVLRSIPRDDVPRTTTILTDGIGPMHESFAGASEVLSGPLVVISLISIRSRNSASLPGAKLLLEDGPVGMCVL